MTRPTFRDQCNVLGELWLNYREEMMSDDAWSDFLKYNNIGLPLAFFFSEGLVSSPVGLAIETVDETYTWFCEYIAVDPFTYFGSLEEAFAASPQAGINAEQLTEELTEDEKPPMDTRYQPTYSDFPGLLITEGAWAGMEVACHEHGSDQISVRLHILPCQCGGYHQGLTFVEHANGRDSMVESSAGVLFVDRMSAHLLRSGTIGFAGARKRFEGNSLLGFNIRVDGLLVCQCGDSWEPTQGAKSFARRLNLSS